MRQQEESLTWRCVILLRTHEDSNSTLLRALLTSCKHVHPKHFLGLGPELSQLPRHPGSQHADCPAIVSKHDLSVNIRVFLDSYAQRAVSFLFPPHYQECGLAGIYQTCISNLKKYSTSREVHRSPEKLATGQNRQGTGQATFFKTSLDRNLG